VIPRLYYLVDWLAERADRHHHRMAAVAGAFGAVALLLAGILLLTGHFAGALVSVLLTGVSITAASTAWRNMSLADTVAQYADELGELRARLDILEPTVELQSAQSNLSATLMDDLASVIEDRLPERSFPRLLFSKSGGVAQEASVESATEDEQYEEMLEDLESESIDPDPIETEPLPLRRSVVEAHDTPSLRAAFSASIRAADFAAALTHGQQIVSSAPNSRMAADFLALRPYLEHRASFQPVKQAQ
jgi:hypothetical protein